MSQFLPVIRELQMVYATAFGDVRGASDSEVERVRQAFGHPLPEEYVDFLRNFGTSSGNLQLFGDYDFTCDAVLSAFEDFDAEVPLLPIAVSEGGNADFLCLLVRPDEREVSPPVYSAWAPVRKVNPRDLWALSFFHWMASQLVHSSVLSVQKYVSRLTPDVDWKYVAITEVVNVDMVVCSLFLQLGFALFLDGLAGAVYTCGGTLLIYQRVPVRRSFAIKIGTDQPGLHKVLAGRLSALLRTDICVITER